MVCVYGVYETQYNSLQKNDMPAEITQVLCFKEHKLTFLVNITGTPEALTREYVGCVYRCIYIQHVQHAQYGRGWAGELWGTSGVAGGLSVTCLCHMSTPWHKDPPTL